MKLTTSKCLRLDRAHPFTKENKSFVLPFSGSKVYLEQAESEMNRQLGWQSYDFEPERNENESDYLTPVYLGTSHDSNLFAAAVSESTLTPLLERNLQGAFFASRDALNLLAPRAPDTYRDSPLNDSSEVSTFLWAQSLLKHRRTFCYCPVCATPLKPKNNGRQMACLACSPARDFYPRVDPVIITLIVDRLDATSPSAHPAVLLCRLPTSPKRRYSCVAGFLEPGESVEACVRREAKEEVGVAIGKVQCLLSEPWPTEVGSNLMIGCIAEVEGKEFAIDPNEIEDARWFSKPDVFDIYAKRSDEFILPEHYTTAYKLLHYWLAHDIS